MNRWWKTRVLCAAAVAALTVAPAGAQEPGSGGTGEVPGGEPATTVTTTTTAPASTTLPTGPTTTFPAGPPSGPDEGLQNEGCAGDSCGAFDDGDHEESPDGAEPVAPRWETTDGGLSLHAVAALDGARRMLEERNGAWLDALDREAAARIALQRARREERQARAALGELSRRERQAALAVADARAALEARARAAYVAGPGGSRSGLGARSASRAAESQVYLDFAAAEGREGLDRLRRTEAAAGRSASAAGDLLARRVRERRAAEAALEAAAGAVAETAAGRDAAAAGVAVLAGDPSDTMVFPVAGGGWRFSNDWGMCRGSGCSRSHQGTDILAPQGAPAVAIESGTIRRVGWNHLGGHKLWLHGDSGTQYYYAHFVAYAAGVADGVRVRAGDTLGFVGNTGAPWAPPHLHLQVHPGGGAAVNPYPFLVAIGGGRQG